MKMLCFLISEKDIVTRKKNTFLISRIQILNKKNLIIDIKKASFE